MKQIKNALIGLCLIANVAWADLPKSPVAYVSSGEALSAAVVNLERSLSTPIELRGTANTKFIRGRYVAPNAEAFLEQFCERNGLFWDYQNGRIILSTEEPVKKAKPATPAAAPSISARIVYDPKDPNKYGLMVFQLQNAQAEDRRITSGGSAGSRAVPGVATLFRQFTGITGGTPPAPVAAPAAAGATPMLPPPPPVSSVNLMSLFVKGNEGNAAASAAPGAPAARPGAPASPMVNVHERGVYADPRLNVIMVRDKVSLFDSYKEIITLLDRPADMVQLEAFIVDIQKDQVENLGVNLGLGGGLATNLILQPFNSRRLLAQIKAMEATGQAETLSVPSVVSLDNEQALFSSRQNFFISVAGAYNATVNQVTAETQLLVTPQIANDTPGVPADQKRVKLLVNIQDAQANASTSTNSSNLLVSSSSTTSLPSTTENQINTQAVVRSGDTLVIGGQVVRKKLSSTVGLPGASKVGIFGRLFSEQVNEMRDYVRVYVVRPKILGEDSASANVATEGSRYRQMAAEATK